MKVQVRERRASSVTVADDAIVIRIERPDVENSPTVASEVSGSRSDRAALLGFAARADCYQGLVLWHRYEALYSLLMAKQSELESDPSADAYTRLYDPLCQVAASYAVAAGVQHYTAERFVESAVACMERIPALGRMLRDGLINSASFRRAVEQTALVDDADILAFIDAEAAARLREVGGLSAARVETILGAIVAEHDPDAVTLTREEVRAAKRVQVNPLTDTASELIVTASAEDVAIAKDVLDAVIAGVCPNDPRTKGARRSDAAMARINGTDFVCECGREDCTARLAPADIASRCARIVLHVVLRKEVLEGTSQTAAHLDGHGPISATHIREMASRPDAVRRELNLDDVIAQASRPDSGYRPSAALDTAVRGLFGTCSWPGCARPAWKCDLDHVCEYDHADPSAGGVTCICNLNAKCRFHHGLKTHANGWVDDQIVDAAGVVWTEVTSPEGITVRQQALNMWLLPELGHLQCGHGSPTRREARHAGDEPERSLTRLQAKHRYRMQKRAANRRAREAIAHDAGAPPF
ncbi:HNH endonuclease signature motif containing protein [Gordonia cholesterolivorans]|uniref:HNH endonuclease signature motif containing protein n=1 Tax=Gordonia cholesterolivorans TaxID=559625 RepID=A0ABN3HJ26_9ACTN